MGNDPYAKRGIDRLILAVITHAVHLHAWLVYATARRDP